MAKKVLIIDDDLTGSVMLSKALSKSGYETRTAFTADEALKRLGQDRFDLVVVGLELQKSDGLEVLRRLGSAGVPDTIPVIGISSSREDATSKTAIQLGATDVVQKPVELDDFVLRAGRAIERGPRSTSRRFLKSLAPGVPTGKTPARGTNQQETLSLTPEEFLGRDLLRDSGKIVGEGSRRARPG
jgi:two-component system response regulator HydG